LPTSRTEISRLPFWTPATASRIGLIRSFAVFGSPRTSNWMSTEWPSREIWPPPPCLNIGFWMFVTFGWRASIWTSAATVETNAGLVASYRWLWTRMFSVAGWMSPLP
jgi:hypothetical protein